MFTRVDKGENPAPRISLYHTGENLSLIHI